MDSTSYGCLALLTAQLGRTRSLELCLRVARMIGWIVVVESGSYRVDVPGSNLTSVYFWLDALVDDVLAESRLMLGWT